MLTDTHSWSLFLLLYTLETSNQAETVETRRIYVRHIEAEMCDQHCARRHKQLPSEPINQT